MKALDNSKSGSAVGNVANLPLRHGKKYYAGQKSYMKRQVAKCRRRQERLKLSPQIQTELTRRQRP